MKIKTNNESHRYTQKLTKLKKDTHLSKHKMNNNITQNLNNPNASLISKP